MEVIKEHWGFEELLPDQEEVLRATAEGRDALVVLHTGAGKSLCFQAPALLSDGVTIVVSPLISLMKDQISALHARGVPASYLSSTLNWTWVKQTKADLEDGHLKLLYVAPEALVQESFIGILERVKVAAFVVDEAHCIVRWGSHFRKDYTKLGSIFERWDVPVRAFTATATHAEREFICQQLRLKDPVSIVGDFDRPNFQYRVLPRDDKLGLAQVMEVIGQHPGESGIVYCLAKKDTQELADALARRGVRCRPYHAGLHPAARDEAQEDFVAGRVDVIVATVAFGMGIDKPDVRFVVHVGLPFGIANYAQETGRAGRDGKHADCVLLWSVTGLDYNRAMRVHRGNTRTLREGRHWLQEMTGYASGTRCRRTLLEDLFDYSERRSPCNKCDICVGEMSPLPDAAELARTLLNGVSCMGNSFSAAYVAGVLLGKNVKLIRTRRHLDAPCHGALKGKYSEIALIAYLEQLAAQGFLVQGRGVYRALQLSEAGRALLKGEGGDDDVVLLHHAAFDAGRRKPTQLNDARSAGGSDQRRRPTQKAEADPPELLGWLRSHSLEAYHGTMLEHGFDRLGDLLVANKEEIDEMLHVVGVKPGHAMRFRRGLEEATQGQEQSDVRFSPRGTAQLLEAYHLAKERARARSPAEAEPDLSAAEDEDSLELLDFDQDDEPRPQRRAVVASSAQEPDESELEALATASTQKEARRTKKKRRTEAAEPEDLPAGSRAARSDGAASPRDDELDGADSGQSPSDEVGSIASIIRADRLGLSDFNQQKLQDFLGAGAAKKVRRIRLEEGNKRSAEIYADHPLAISLKALRSKLASDLKRPAYSIFQDKTLYELVKLRPKDESELLDVYGIGEQRLAQFGPALLEEIAKH